jgi:hypothetical protein
MRVSVALAAFMGAALSTQGAAAQGTFSGTYVCLDEFGGGIAYDQRTQRWLGTTFSPSRRFVLKLNFAPERRPDKLPEGIEVYTGVISIVGDEGSNHECSWGGSRTLAVFSDGDLLCYAALSTYRFNLKTLRFTTAYQRGYVDGEDDNQDTPRMMGGSCAKIE